MANIFKTKEMYKNIAPTTRVTPLRKVRGVYVTGPYRPPHYIDHTLTIVSLINRKATIVPYTEASAYAVESSHGQLPCYGSAFLDIRESSTFSITRYSTREEQAEPAYGSAMLDIRESSPFKITKFTTRGEDAHPGYGSAMLDIRESGTFSITKPLLPVYVKIPPGDTLLNIYNWSSTKAIIAVVSN
jgi:hypothetical protein